MTFYLLLEQSHLYLISAFRRKTYYVESKHYFHEQKMKSDKAEVPAKDITSDDKFLYSYDHYIIQF